MFPGGVLSIYPEANPNFYKQHTVFIPSCSSDLFVGVRDIPDPANGLYFSGQRIVQAVSPSPSALFAVWLSSVLLWFLFLFLFLFLLFWLWHVVLFSCWGKPGRMKESEKCETRPNPATTAYLLP